MRFLTISVSCIRFLLPLLLLLTLAPASVAKAPQTTHSLPRVVRHVQLSRLPIPVDKPRPKKTTGYGNGSCVALAQAKGFNIHAGAAKNWPAAARKLGYTVNTKPVVGSVIVTKEGSKGTDTGHVAVVTAVTPDSIKIVEQNYQGKYIVSTRLLSANSPIVTNAVFIHPL